MIKPRELSHCVCNTTPYIQYLGIKKQAKNLRVTLSVYTRLSYKHKGLAFTHTAFSLSFQSHQSQDNKNCSSTKASSKCQTPRNATQHTNQNALHTRSRSPWARDSIQRAPQSH